MSVFDVLNLVRAEVPGFVSTSVVTLENGLQLANVCGVDADDAAAADAFHSDIYRATHRALLEIQGVESRTDGIVLLSENHMFLSVPLDDEFFWHVVTRSETTLGFSQAVMRKYREPVRVAVRQLFTA